MMRAVTLALMVLLAGCSPRDDAPRGEGAAGTARSRPVVYTVNYPLAWMAERIGGEWVEVVFPVPAEVDPAFWRPAPEEIAAYQEADLILLNGAGYANWTRSAFLPESKLEDTSAGFADRILRVDGAVTHAHGPGGEHAHGEEAFTVWLDPTLAVLQGAAIRDAFSSRWPAHAEAFAAGQAGLEHDLLALDEEMAAVMSGHAATPLVFSHPVYQYFVGRYGLTARSVHWEPDEIPDEAQWNELGQLRADHPAAWMVWEGEPRAETTRRLEEAGVRSVVFDPCGNRPAEGDFLGVMRANAAAMRRALEDAGD